MLPPEIIERKMDVLIGLGWKSVIQIDGSNALLKLNSKDELLIDVKDKPFNWILRYQGKYQPWIEYSTSIPDKFLETITTLISQYNTALRVILDEITDWREFQ